MAHRIIIMRDRGEYAEGGGVAVAEPKHREMLDNTVSHMMNTLPRMFRTLKHRARNAESEHPAAELGDSQMWVLQALAAGSEISAKLADHFNVTDPTMTRIIDGLVKKGYVERSPDPSDRRRIDLQLTGAGLEVARFANEQFRATLAEFIRPLSDKQLADLALACKHISTLLPQGSYDYSAVCPPKTNTQGQ
jgi:DNA-binding MarR family transcriptional regulator